MGKRGPAKKPTRLRIIEGNPGKRKLNHSEPQPIGVPMPGDLTGDALDKWNRVVSSMPPTLYRQADEGLLQAYAFSWSLYSKAVAALEATPLILRTEKTGVLHQNPWLAILNKQAALMATLGTRLGLDPTARQGLEMRDAAPKGKFDGLIGPGR